MYASLSSIRFEKRLVLGATLFLLGLTGATARAETENCTEVPSAPFTITAQGLWCLKHDLTTNQTSGAAIVITANNVTLDLNGWKVGGQAAGPNTGASGIESNAVNVTVKNGTVRGFYYGVLLIGRGAVVENLLLDQNTSHGIWVSGQDTIVRNNQVVDTGGQTLNNGEATTGIRALGTGSLIEHNSVSNLIDTIVSAEVGILVLGTNSLVRNNFITDTAKPTSGGSSWGISANTTFVSVDQNTISNFNRGINYFTGVGTGIYARNTVTDCDFNYIGGTDGGGNAP